MLHHQQTLLSRQTVRSLERLPMKAQIKRNVFLSLSMCLLANQSALALPDLATKTGNSCSVCHADAAQGGRKVTGFMEVADFAKRMDLGTQLDGKQRGAIKTFQVAPGGKVTLSVAVLNGAAPYALQIKRLEQSGQKNSKENFLVWSESNAAANVWVKQDNPTVPPGITDPYFTKGIVSDGTKGTFIFDLAIDIKTPADVYDLEFAMAGQDDNGLFYQDEHFYLEVVEAVLLTKYAVTWSTALKGYVLEAADRIEGPWSPFTGSQGVVGSENVILMDTSDSKKFYRLVKQP